MVTQVRQLVTADGTYATQSALRYLRINCVKIMLIVQNSRRHYFES